MRLLSTPPRPTPEFCIFVLRLLAAFWAAESTDEKNPVAALLVSLRSSGGVSWLEATEENLLFNGAVAEADLLLLWGAKVREAGSSADEVKPNAFQPKPLWGASWRVGDGCCTGVGGVLMMAGDELPTFAGSVSEGRAPWSGRPVVRERMPEGATALAGVCGAVGGWSVGAATPLSSGLDDGWAPPPEIDLAAAGEGGGSDGSAPVEAD